MNDCAYHKACSGGDIDKRGCFVYQGVITGMQIGHKAGYNARQPEVDELNKQKIALDFTVWVECKRDGKEFLDPVNTQITPIELQELLKAKLVAEGIFMGADEKIESIHLNSVGFL